MRRNELKKIRYFARWILLTVVLTGIFFSSGEGIQLLPFPVSPDKSEKGGAFLRDEKDKSYTFSIRHCSQMLSLKSKAQKNFKDLACSGLRASEFDFDGIIGSASEKNHPEIAYFYASRFLNSPSNRAPPLI